MVFFNVVGLQGSTFYHFRVYQRSKFNTVKEGMCFKFSNIVQKDQNILWATAASVISYTSAVDVNVDMEDSAPMLPEERPPEGIQTDLKTAMKTPDKSTVTGKVVMVNINWSDCI